MNLIEELKAKADANGDGKLDADDLNHFQEQHPEQREKVEQLKAKADTNGDGKVDFADVQGMFGALGDMFGKR